MKNLYFTFITLFVFTFSNAQIVDIPDANFKAALLNHENPIIDINDDGEIQVSEAEVVLTLFVDDKSISSLEGIQNFTNLEELLCNNNQLSSLDVTQNINMEALYCHNNQLSSLDVTQNINLERLHCHTNQLSGLDVTGNTNLIWLFCPVNQINSLYVTQNINLERLHCYANQLSSLDVTQNINLEHLYCYNNNQLSNLNIKNGNNHNFFKMLAYGNPNLICIQVDDVNYANSQDCANDDWCIDEWSEYSEECELGVEDNTLANITLYPNPTQDILNIESQQQIETVKIYSLQGQLIKESSSSSVDVSQLTAGLYFVQVTVDGKSQTQKLIKN